MFVGGLLVGVLVSSGVGLFAGDFVPLFAGWLAGQLCVLVGLFVGFSLLVCLCDRRFVGRLVCLFVGVLLC